MTDIISPDIVKDITIRENDAITTPTKKVLLYGWDSDGLQKVRLKSNNRGELYTIEGLEIPPHDYIELGYTGNDLTSVVYKSGGANGTVVATLTLTYSGGKLISVAKT